ncbi:hypothetical protein [Micromonospora echinofusca]|uniref:hypothetical protein n=1 Tax=Micromonospora echinofusca TaxID=47858 RepID=UPI001E5A8199|nr:hypothetical protein [Micromonospora echinofusca]
MDGLLPDTYVSAGSLVHMEAVSGGLPTAADEDSPLPISASALTPAGLAGLLAEHAYVYKVKTRKTDGGNPEMYEDEVTPPRDILSSVLAGKTWPGVPPLRGIIGAPVLRRDGTLLQQPGYDPQTGLYLAAKVTLPPVPDQPTPEQVRDARTFLLGQFLRDFPWASAADRANYVALLATPILRHFTRSLTPFALIDATMPSSGKTILTAGPGMLYGQRVMTWAYSDEELRKSITAVLAEQVGVVIWDNLAEGTVIDSPVLAQLVTSGVWSDRQLGASRNVATVNDRLWMATGNNLQVGGDMASRTVRVHLDPDMPRPELRDQAGFGIPHLDQWITDPANQLTVLWHLLVLVLDWTRQGAPRVSGLSMRQFTPWAHPRRVPRPPRHRRVPHQRRRHPRDRRRRNALARVPHLLARPPRQPADDRRRPTPRRRTHADRQRHPRPVGRAVHHHPQRPPTQPAATRAVAHRASRAVARRTRRPGRQERPGRPVRVLGRTPPGVKPAEPSPHLRNAAPTPPHQRKHPAEIRT